MLRKLLFCLSLVGVATQGHAAYVPVPVTGFNADIIANGFGPASSSTTSDIENGGHALMAINFNPAGILPARFLPANGVINSASTPGLSFQLAGYSANNSLRIGGVGMDSVVLATPQPAGEVIVLSTSGGGNSTADVKVNFTDGTNQVFPTTTFQDWYNGTNAVVTGIGTVEVATNIIDNDNSNPRLYQNGYTISTANLAKQIRSISFTRIGGGVLHIMGVAIQTVCTGTPTAGTTIASSLLACPGANINFSLVGNTAGGTQLYQLQTATTAAGTYTNVGTASTTASASAAVTVTGWYRLAVTCGANTSHSAPAQVVVATSLPAGTYTINSTVPASSTNFVSFNAAVAALSCGIAGPITFNVTAGAPVYQEQVTFAAIPGVSGINTITFNGNGNTVSYNATLSSAPHTWGLNGADHITVNNLNIVGVGSDYALVGHLWNQADSNRFNNCTFTAPYNGASTNQFTFSISGDVSSGNAQGNAGNNNILTDCVFNSGYYCGYVVGTSTNRALDNRFINCQFLDFYTYGFRTEQSDGTKIVGCNLERQNRTITSGFYGIYMGSGTKNTLVERNRLHDMYARDTTNISIVFGLYGNGHAAVNEENIFRNNIIYNVKSEGRIEAIHLNNYNYYKAYHNTVYINHPGSTSTAAANGIQSRGSTGLDIRNNNIYIRRGGTGNKQCLYYNNAKISNYNNLYVDPSMPNSYIGFYGNNLSLPASATVAAFNAVSGTDANSFSIDPVFSSPTSGILTPTALLLDNKGTSLPAVPTDIVNVTRSTTTPDVGAYEFTGSANTLVGTSIICQGGTTALIGSPAGGTFATSNGAIASVNTTTGLVTGTGPGTATITYTNGSVSTTLAVTVNSIPATPVITAGTNALCVGNITALSSSIGGGNWTSSNAAVASVNAIGHVAANASGTGTISYFVTNNAGCIATGTTSITVNAAPTVTAITGSTSICMGDTTTLANTTAGGIWSSANTAVATIAANGLVTGTSSGSATISYVVTNTTGCATTVTTIVNVNPLPAALPAITGDLTVCVGDTVTLANAIAGGTWASSSMSVALISSSGFINAAGTGTSTITYTITNASGCSASVTALFTVAGPLIVAASTGDSSICVGSLVTWVNTATGGIWSVDNGTIASVSAGGVVNGLTAGTANITYTITNAAGCTAFTSEALTVHPTPIPVITATGNVLSTGTFASYNWKLAGSAIPGANGQTYTATANGVYTVEVIDANGCSNISAPVTLTGVGIEGVGKSGQITVFPNPAKDILFVKCTEPCTIQIFDAQGRIVASKELKAPSGNTPAEISVTGIAPGFYQVRMNSENGALLKIEKLIVR